MKLLLLTDGLFPLVLGGMQKHSTMLANALVDIGVELTVYHCTYSYEQLNELESVDFKFKTVHFQFPHSKIKAPGHYVRSSYQLSKLYFQSFENEIESFDGVYVQGYAGWSLLKNKKVTYPKIAVNFHGLNMFKTADGIRAKLENSLLRKSVIENLQLADFVISLGGELTRVLESLVSIQKIKVLNNGVSNSWLENSKQNTLNSKPGLIFIGRNDKVKRLDFFLKETKSFGDKLSIRIIGDIDESIIQKYPNVVFEGEIKDEKQLIKFIDRSNALVLTSVSEGAPTVILEAMARGRVIIASKVGAVEEMVHKNGGWLFGSLDKNEFANSLEDFLNSDSEKLMSMGTYNREVIKHHFLWNAIASKTEKLFIKD